jgi:5-methylcytosine-specific restriction endonuclease McrA
VTVIHAKGARHGQVCVRCGRPTAAGPYCDEHAPLGYKPGSRSGRQTSEAYKRLKPLILARDTHTCYRCGKQATQVDHIVPVARGGTATPYNLRACCAACNASKGDR